MNNAKYVRHLRKLRKRLPATCVDTIDASIKALCMEDVNVIIAGCNDLGMGFELETPTIIGVITKKEDMGVIHVNFVNDLITYDMRVIGSLNDSALEITNAVYRDASIGGLL